MISNLMEKWYLAFRCDKWYQRADLSCNVTVRRCWNSKIKTLSNKIQSQFINFIIIVIKYFDVISTQFNYCNILQRFLIFYIICNNQSHSTSHVTVATATIYHTVLSVNHNSEYIGNRKSGRMQIFQVFYFAWFPYSICPGILTLILIKFNW